MAEYGEFKNEGIWQHFLREKQGQSAKCKICKTVLKTVGGSTKGLHEHLRRVHSTSVLKRKADDEEDKPGVQAPHFYVFTFHGVSCYSSTLRLKISHNCRL